MKTRYPIRILEEALFNVRHDLSDCYVDRIRSHEQLKTEKDKEMRRLLKELITRRRRQTPPAETRKEDLIEAIEILKKAKSLSVKEKHEKEKD